MEVCCECVNANGDKFFPLLCKEHSVCRICLVKRARDHPNDVMVCAKDHDRRADHEPFKQTVSDAGNPSLGNDGIWIFVDDSTIWLEAKRLQSTVRGYLTSEDHRLRIDMRKLANVIASDRHIKKGILYATEPPPIYEVWRNKAGWDIEFSELKSVSAEMQVGTKEKQINAKLVAKATATAILTPQEERTTMVFVTGDAHVVPALKKAVNERWEIEIYMWKDSISRDIHLFAAEYPNQVKICPLDEHLDFVCFFHYELNIQLNEEVRTNINIKKWLHRRRPMYCGAVLSIEPQAFPNHNLSTTWIRDLEMITKWPFQYYWFIDAENKKTNNLVLTFKTDSLAGPFNLPDFLSSESAMKLPHVLSVKAYSRFIGEEYEEEKDEELEKIDEALDRCNIQFSGRSSPVTSESDSSSVGTAAGFQSTSRKKKQSKQLYSTPCKYEKNCKYGTSCHSGHSKDDQDYFRSRRGGRGNPRRKTTLCQHFLERRCRYRKQECERAHGEEDAFCPTCVCKGHLKENCPAKPKEQLSLVR